MNTDVAGTPDAKQTALITGANIERVILGDEIGNTRVQLAEVARAR